MSQIKWFTRMRIIDAHESIFFFFAITIIDLFFTECIIQYKIFFKHYDNLLMGYNQLL